MIRDFSQAKKQELLDLIDELNAEQNSFLSLMKKIIQGRESRILRQLAAVDVSFLERYERSVISENNLMKEEIETLFFQVREMDLKYVMKFEEHNQMLNTISESLEALSMLVLPDTFYAAGSASYSSALLSIRENELVTKSGDVESVLLSKIIDLIPTLQLNKKVEFQVSENVSIYLEAEASMGSMDEATLSFLLEEQKCVFNKCSFKQNLGDALSVKGDLKDEMNGSLSLSADDLKVQIKTKGEVELSDKITVDGKTCTLKTSVSLTEIKEELSVESKDEKGSLTTKLGVVVTPMNKGTKALQKDSEKMDESKEKSRVEELEEKIAAFKTQEISSKEVVFNLGLILDYVLGLSKIGLIGN